MLRWIFFILCGNSPESLSLRWDFWSAMLFVSLKQLFWSPYFMRYLHSSNMMLIPKFQSKADEASWFSWPIYFGNSSRFFFINVIFLYKLKASLEACFYDAILIVTILKRHMIDYIPWLYNVIKSFKKALNSKTFPKNKN